MRRGKGTQIMKKIVLLGIVLLCMNSIEGSAFTTVLRNLWLFSTRSYDVLFDTDEALKVWSRLQERDESDDYESSVCIERALTLRTKIDQVYQIAQASDLEPLETLLVVEPKLRKIDLFAELSPLLLKNCILQVIQFLVVIETIIDQGEKQFLYDDLLVECNESMVKDHLIPRLTLLCNSSHNNPYLYSYTTIAIAASILFLLGKNEQALYLESLLRDITIEDMHAAEQALNANDEMDDIEEDSKDYDVSYYQQENAHSTSAVSEVKTAASTEQSRPQTTSFFSAFTNSSYSKELVTGYSNWLHNAASSNPFAPTMIMLHSPGTGGSPKLYMPISDVDGKDVKKAVQKIAHKPKKQQRALQQNNSLNAYQVSGEYKQGFVPHWLGYLGRMVKTGGKLSIGVKNEEQDSEHQLAEQERQRLSKRLLKEADRLEAYRRKHPKQKSHEERQVSLQEEEEFEPSEQDKQRRSSEFDIVDRDALKVMQGLPRTPASDFQRSEVYGQNKDATGDKGALVEELVIEAPVNLSEPSQSSVQPLEVDSEERGDGKTFGDPSPAVGKKGPGNDSSLPRIVVTLDSAMDGDNQAAKTVTRSRSNTASTGVVENRENMPTLIPYQKDSSGTPKELEKVPESFDDKRQFFVSKITEQSDSVIRARSLSQGARRDVLSGISAQEQQKRKRLLSTPTQSTPVSKEVAQAVAADSNPQPVSSANLKAAADIIVTPPDDSSTPHHTTQDSEHSSEKKNEKQ